MTSRNPYLKAFLAFLDFGVIGMMLFAWKSNLWLLLACWLLGIAVAGKIFNHFATPEERRTDLEDRKNSLE